jgi:hypothetical protein
VTTPQAPLPEVRVSPPGCEGHPLLAVRFPGRTGWELVRRNNRTRYIHPDSQLNKQIEDWPLLVQEIRPDPGRPRGGYTPDHVIVTVPAEAPQPCSCCAGGLFSAACDDDTCSECEHPVSAHGGRSLAAGLLAAHAQQPAPPTAGTCAYGWAGCASDHAEMRAGGPLAVPSHVVPAGAMTGARVEIDPERGVRAFNAAGQQVLPPPGPCRREMGD